MTDAERAIRRLRLQAETLRRCYGAQVPPHVLSRIREKIRTADTLEKALAR